MFVVFDIETTGLSEFSNDVIEFAYVMFDENCNYVKGEQLYFYYNGVSWSEEAEAIHHISLDFLKTQADKFKENLVKMYTVLNHANVCGHNAARFDCPFCKVWLMRMGIRNLEYGVIQDTMKAFKPVTKKSRIKLTKLIEYINITPDMINTLLPIWFPGADASHAHEAAYDVVATALLTLHGIRNRLIAFEPLINKSSEVNSDDIAGIYSTPTKSIDPKRFIVKLLDSGESDDEYHYRYVNHDYSKFSDDLPSDDDIIKYHADGKLFPIMLRQRDNTKSYIGTQDGVTYEFTENVNNMDTFNIQTSYGTFTDLDVDITMIIKNNFK